MTNHSAYPDCYAIPYFYMEPSHDWRQAEISERHQYETEHERSSCNLSQRDQETPMHIGKLSQSKYLKQADFDKPALLTVDHLTVENLARPGEERKDRAVMYFAELDKGLVLNKTNLTRAAKIFGSEETDDWSGKKLVVYYDDSVEMGGQIVGGLRVRGPKPQQQPPQRRQTPMEGIQGMDNDVPY